jgi:hypothetical protein
MPLIPYKGFMGGAYQLDSPNASNQICQNFILEPYEGVPGKNNEEWRMKGTPACLLFKTIGSGPIRCQHFADKVGRAFVVSGTELLKSLRMRRFTCGEQSVPVRARFQWPMMGCNSSSRTASIGHTCLRFEATLLDRLPMSMRP